MKENKSDAKYIREELFHENMSLMFDDINKDFINNRIKEQLEYNKDLFEDSKMEIKLVYISDITVYTSRDFSSIKHSYETLGFRDLFFEFTGMNSIDERFILDKYYMKVSVTYLKRGVEINNKSNLKLFGYIDSPFNKVDYNIELLIGRLKSDILINAIESAITQEYENKRLLNQCLSSCNGKENMLLLSFLNQLSNNLGSINSREEVDEQEKEWFKEINEIIEGY